MRSLLDMLQPPRPSCWPTHCPISWVITLHPWIPLSITKTQNVLNASRTLEVIKMAVHRLPQNRIKSLWFLIPLPSNVRINHSYLPSLHLFPIPKVQPFSVYSSCSFYLILSQTQTEVPTSSLFLCKQTNKHTILLPVDVQNNFPNTSSQILKAYIPMPHFLFTKYLPLTLSLNPTPFLILYKITF